MLFQFHCDYYYFFFLNQFHYDYVKYYTISNNSIVFVCIFIQSMLMVQSGTQARESAELVSSASYPPYTLTASKPDL